MDKLDESAMDDLLDCLENMTAAENHLLETATKKLETLKSENLLDKALDAVAPKQVEIPIEFELADGVRIMRQQIQQELIFGKENLSDEEKKRTKAGDSACTLKHLNFARTTMKEVAQKFWRLGKKKEAIMLFRNWHILGKTRTGLVSTKL